MDIRMRTTLQMRPRHGARGGDRRSERGLNLIEVVVALALLAMVLLGISTLFIRGGKSVKSGKELTEATSVGTDMMEELDKQSYRQVYENFGATASSTSLTADTRTNTYAQRWQPQIDQRLWHGYAIIVLTPMGSASPLNFGSGQAIRVQVTVNWDEGLRHRTASFETTRM